MTQDTEEWPGGQAKEVMDEFRATFALKRLLEAVRPIADDFMTSETHHPGYVLIPTARFDAIRAALGSAEG